MPAVIVGVGAGGHARVVLEILLAAGADVIGLVDPRPELVDSALLGIPVVGDDSLLPGLRERASHAFVGIGGVGDNGPRRRLYELVRSAGFEVVATIHPSAVISSSAAIGKGATILAGAIVATGARLGDDVLLNTGAIVDHDCIVGDHVHVATGARLAGGVVVDSEAHVGLGAAVREGVRIGRRAIVGAGAVVISDVAPDTVVVGVPARPLRRRGA